MTSILRSTDTPQYEEGKLKNCFSFQRVKEEKFFPCFFFFFFSILSVRVYSSEKDLSPEQEENFCSVKNSLLYYESIHYCNISLLAQVQNCSVL